MYSVYFTLIFRTTAQGAWLAVSQRGWADHWPRTCQLRQSVGPEERQKACRIREDGTGPAGCTEPSCTSNCSGYSFCSRLQAGSPYHISSRWAAGVCLRWNTRLSCWPGGATFHKQHQWYCSDNVRKDGLMNNLYVREGVCLGGTKKGVSFIRMYHPLSNT